MKNNKKLVGQIVLNISFTIIFLVVLFVIVASGNLRPTSDDYCFGAYSAAGSIGGVIRWWNNWSSNLFPLLIENIIVGLPLLHLPWQIASAIPFMLTAFGMSFAIIYIVPNNLIYIPRIFISILIPFSWWTFLWANELMGSMAGDVSVSLAYGLTHWQTLNGAYIIPVLILLCIWSEIWNNTGRVTSRVLLAVIFLGLLGGVSVTTLALALIVLCGLVPICSWIFRIGVSPHRIILWWVLFFTILLSFLISSLLSPGNNFRMIELESNFDLTWERIHYLRFAVVPSAIGLWARSYLSWSSLLLFILISCLNWLVIAINKNTSATQKEPFNYDWYLDAALMVAGFSLLQLMIIVVAEDFAYPAYWHYASPLVCVFLSIFFAGSYAGIKVALLSKINLIYLCIPILFMVIVISSVSNINMIKSIAERSVRWGNGSAPITQLGFGDIGNDDYIGICWERLNNVRSEETKRGN